jgi:hypothetical protein
MKSISLLILSAVVSTAAPVAVGVNGEGLNQSPFITALGGTTAGKALFQLPNPGAIRFLRVNADNTVSALSDTDFKAAIGATGGSFAGLTGQPTDNANLALSLIDKQTRTWEGAILPRTKRRLAADAVPGAPRPYRVKHLVMGDSYNVSLSELLDTQVAPLREVGFGLTHTTAGAVVTDTAQWTRTPNGGTLYRMTGAGQSVQYGGATDIECYRIKVFYQAEDITGTFAVETNTNSAGWVEVPTATTASPINADNGIATPGVQIFTYDFTSTEPRKVRAKWVSGTVRILGFVLSDIREAANDLRSGSAEYGFSTGGQDLVNWASCPQAIWNTIIQNLEPDFVTIKGDDSNWNGVCDATSTGLYGRMQIARDMDWVFIGRHPASASQYDGQAEGANTNSGSELLAMDRQMRDFAIAQNQLWVNPRKIFPAYSVMQATTIMNGAENTTAKLISGDNTHLTPAGNYYQAQAIMGILGRALIDNSKTHKPLSQAFANTPRYTPVPLSVALPAGKAVGFGLVARTGTGASGTNFRPIFGINKMGDDGEVGVNIGQSDEMHVFANRFGNWFFNNGTLGFGSGLTTTPRNPSAMVELHSGNRTTTPVLSLSGASGHTGNLFRIYSGAATTAATEGSITATIDMNGLARFDGGIKGTTTNNDATALNVGEYVSSIIPTGSAVSLTTATAANVTSISLTAGDWDVVGHANMSAAAATVTAMSAGVTPTTATVPTDGSEAYSGVMLTAGTGLDTITPSRKRVSLSATTTIYLVAKATFSAGSVSAFGQINARRVR